MKWVLIVSLCTHTIRSTFCPMMVSVETYSDEAACDRDKPRYVAIFRSEAQIRCIDIDREVERGLCEELG